MGGDLILAAPQENRSESRQQLAWKMAAAYGRPNALPRLRGSLVAAAG